MTSTASSHPLPDSEPLVVRTVSADIECESLIELLKIDAPLAWLRNGDGLVGWGRAAAIHTDGPDRFSDADAWWAKTAASAVVRDEVGLPGTGLIAFGSFGFADAPGDSVLVVPEVLVGRRGDQVWLTTATRGGVPGPEPVVRSEPALPPVDLRFSDGALNGDEWMAVVAEAVARIEAGDVEKVVLARDLCATTAEPIDVRWPLQQLESAYPMCWSFHVDGLVGATPEMLVRSQRGLVTSRVLAGTIRRTGDDEHDLALAGALARSSKDLEEHEYAVRSVADSFEQFCSSINAPESPFVLHLPNVMHLATDVAGVLEPDTAVSSLALAEALHPSAAVGGTPAAAASELITSIEGMSRGRYAGPVGWMNATGDGEWGLALRCAEIEGANVRLFAGCGIVTGSDPESELAEAAAKFVPMRDALASD